MATATELAQQLYDIDSKIADLKTQRMEVEETLAAEMTEQRLELPGVGIFERHRTKDRKAWNHAEVQSSLLRKIRSGEIELLKTADLATGELSIEDDTERAFRVLTECANPTWRTTALKRYDLNPDEFCEMKPGRYTIQFIGNLEGGD